MARHVGYERVEAVAIITIDRPEARNALDAASLTALHAAFAHFGADDAAVLVVTGAGTQAFCAGADLKAIAGGWRPEADAWPVLGHNVHIDKPVIAAVNGDAFGGGFLLAQSCDLCVASDTARFAITEAKWGRGVAWAAPLPRMIPQRSAMELLLTAEPVDAWRAERLGLVNRVCAPDELRAQALHMASMIAANAPATVRAAKALVYRSLLPDRDALRTAAEHLFAPVYSTADAAEGPRAFTDGRAPDWATDPSDKTTGTSGADEPGARP